MIRNSWSRWWHERRRRAAAKRAGAALPRRRTFCHLNFDELESRQLPSVTDFLNSAIPIVLEKSLPQTGLLGPAPAYYSFSLTDSGRLTAEVAPTDGVTRLSLLSADGQVLLQSDGQSPDNPDNLLDLHLTGSPTGTTYYLEVQGLGASEGSYVLMSAGAQNQPPRGA